MCHVQIVMCTACKTAHASSIVYCIDSNNIDVCIKKGIEMNINTNTKADKRFTLNLANVMETKTVKGICYNKCGSGIVINHADVQKVSDLETVETSLAEIGLLP